MTDRTTITEKLAGDASGTGPLRPVLILAHGPAPERIGERVALPRRETVVGRGEPHFEAGPLDDPRMSSRHLVVTPGGAGLDVRDAGSKNGILVHGKRVEAARLQPGDLVQCGRTFLLYRVEPAFDWRPAESALAGVSYLLHLVRQSVERAAAHDLPALITGPSGAGKEPAAREVHRLSRRKGPLVPVNCAALPAELVESELFGHVAGAFTGAGPAKEGLFRRAQSGTLFLDEVGAMPLALQPKLLRAIQERRVRAVGGTREVDVDVRIVAATNEDLPALVRSGGFRADLYGRLSGALIEMPPLAQRREDVGALLHWFLRGRDLEVAPELLWDLFEHPWPLNVRALEQLAMTAASAATEVLGPTPDTRRLLDAQRALGSEARERRAPGAEELERLLERHGGVVSRVALELGVHRYQVYRWMAAAGIDPGTHRDRPED